MHRYKHKEECAYRYVLPADKYTHKKVNECAHVLACTCMCMCKEEYTHVLIHENTHQYMNIVMHIRSILRYTQTDICNKYTRKKVNECAHVLACNCMCMCKEEYTHVLIHDNTHQYMHVRMLMYAFIY